MAEGVKAGETRERELPESFLAEFNSGKLPDVIAAMRELGPFSFRSGTIDAAEHNHVTFEGERDDGTRVAIIFTKGDRYRSPKELDDERKRKDWAPGV